MHYREKGGGDAPPSAYGHDLRLTRAQMIGACAALLLLLLISIKAFGNVHRGTRWLPVPHWLMAVVENVTEVTVLQADYGFFSPDIAPDTRIEVKVVSAGGRIETVPLDLPNSEIGLRFHTSITAFTSFQTYRELVARSLAANVYNARPDAGFIIVSAFRYLLPTREEYRSGTRPSEECFFQAKFTTSLGRAAEQRAVQRRENGVGAGQ